MFVKIESGSSKGEIFNTSQVCFFRKCYMSMEGDYDVTALFSNGREICIYSNTSEEKRDEFMENFAGFLKSNSQ